MRKLIDADKLIADIDTSISDSWKRAVFKSLIDRQPEECGIAAGIVRYI